MNLKKVVYIIGIMILMLFLDYSIIVYQRDVSENDIMVHIEMQSNKNADVQMFYLQDYSGSLEKIPYNANQCDTVYSTASDMKNDVIFHIPVTSNIVRLDPASESGSKIIISNIFIEYNEKKYAEDQFDFNSYVDIHNLDVQPSEKDGVELLTGEDSYISWVIDNSSIIDEIKATNKNKDRILKIIVLAVVDSLLLFLLIKSKVVTEIPREVLTNRSLIVNLSKNDFKTRFAGSYLGIIWAFIQPIITVLVYWFVFQKALNVGTQSTKAGIEVPYVLWLVAGLVPWFYFSEVLSVGTNVLIDYSYLVKKVVFNISTLPIVRIISSLFVHLFFIGFMIIMFLLYKYHPSVYWIQMIYYSMSMIVLCVGLVYMTSAIVIFFRDFGQIINILLQVGIWATPILWNIDAVKMSSTVDTLLRLNPMYYIVCGYRDSLLYQTWFWERPTMTLYYWLVTVFVFVIGTTLFRKLKIHFADVL